MTGLGFETPWVLYGLVLALLPLFRSNVKTTSYPWLNMLPADPLSAWLTVLIRLLLMAAIVLAILGISGAYLKEQKIERVGYGAHIVLLLDRSKSMDNSFAGKAPNGNEQSKASAARGLLNEFVERRRHDLIGIAEYSTSPLFAMPLTENKLAIHAAIDATEMPALAYTNISKGLAMGLSFFERDSVAGSRIILLVSDGAAVIDRDSEVALREQFKQSQVRLYWLFLRGENNPGIFAKPEDVRDDNAQTMPERYLHLFFSGLDIPYQAYEAENRDAMQKAVADIDKLEQFPLPYFETVPKQDLSVECFTALATVLSLLLLCKLCEVNP